MLAILACPSTDLMYQAQIVIARHFDPNASPSLDAVVHQDRRLPGGCAIARKAPVSRPGLKSQKLMSKEVVLAEAGERR